MALEVLEPLQEGAVPAEVGAPGMGAQSSVEEAYLAARRLLELGRCTPEEVRGVRGLAGGQAPG